MKLKSLLPNQQKDPASLLRLYVATAVISVVTVVLLSGCSFYRIFSGLVINMAEEDSVQLCHLLYEQQKLNLLQYIPGRGEQLAINKQDMSQLDHNLREFFHPFDIIKVKIYDTNSHILYSTVPSLIGKINDGDLRLKNALTGNVDAKQVTKEKAQDLADEPLMDVDVVETYVPIWSEGIKTTTIVPPNKIGKGKVLGSFEIYVDVTKYRDQIRAGVVVMTTITAAALAAVFGFSYLLIRRGTLQLAGVQAKLEVLSITDVLTGIANRRYVMTRGEEEFSRVLRSKVKGPETPTLCCIMLDIDHFKNINDTQGHPAGDVVLREVANRMRQHVRPYDIVGRYGGEEFLLLLPGTGLKEGVAVAERIRIAIGEEPFKVGGEVIRVSVSQGISSFDKNDQRLDDLLKRADEGLYKAKDAGRDRVEWVYNSFDAGIFASSQEGTLAAC